MLERHIENALIKKVKDLGGMCDKFTSPAKRSVPDRLVTLPGKPMFLVECKAPGKKATPKQQRDHEKRRALGVTVLVIDSMEDVQCLTDLI